MVCAECNREPDKGRGSCSDRLLVGTYWEGSGTGVGHDGWDRDSVGMRTGRPAGGRVELVH